MRIIAGKYRGRKLSALTKGDTLPHLRPTADRVRESLFNILANGGFGEVFEGGRVLDLFAGTGAVGIEAYSRGVNTVWMIDNGHRASRLINKNLSLLDNPKGIVFKNFNACNLPLLRQEPFNLIFLDPPYGQNLGRYALKSALQNSWIAPGALIVWEENSPMDFPLDFPTLDRRQFGNTFVTFLRSPALF